MAKEKYKDLALILTAILMLLAFLMIAHGAAAIPYEENNVENLREEIVVLKARLQDLNGQISDLTAQQAADNSTLASLLAVLDNHVSTLESELNYLENLESILGNQNIGLWENVLDAQIRIDSLISAVVGLKAENEAIGLLENRLRDEAKQNYDQLSGAFAEMVKTLKSENESLVSQAQQWTLIAIAIVVGIPALWLLKKKGKLRFKFKVPFSTPKPVDIPELDQVERAKNLLLSKGIQVGEPKQPKKKTRGMPCPTGSKRARK